MVECDELDWSEPRICPECGGDVHRHFGDENYDGDYWTWAHCHKCEEQFSSDEFDELKET
jgi:hypothetical protein